MLVVPGSAPSIHSTSLTQGAEFCTQNPCSKISSSSEPECIVGEPVPAPDSCNVCICLNWDILCTNNPCFERQSEVFATQDCIAGEMIPAGDGCNMCVCLGEKNICSNKDCPGTEPQRDESLKSVSHIRKRKIRKSKRQGTKLPCTQGKKYLPYDFDPNCPNECICDNHELMCTKKKCFYHGNKQTPLKWSSGKVEKNIRNAKALLKQENCVEYQPLQSDDACNSCICLHGRKVCTIRPCSDDSDLINLTSHEILLNKIRGSKGNKGNMEKKKRSFCVPFTFFSPDNNRFCRNCFCLHNGLALCLLNLCKYSKDIVNQKEPDDLEEVCTPGEIGYPTKCVTCTCSQQGKWMCTREELALCKERDCDAKDEFHMGFFPYCAGCKCSVKEWYCSIEDQSCEDYSNVTCPLGTFIHNPMQHCSLCLCGGYEKGAHNMCFTEAKCVRQVIGH